VGTELDTRCAEVREKFQVNRAIAVIAIAQLFGTSLWFSANAAMHDLQTSWHLTASDIGWLTNSVQAGFIVGTLISAFTGIADRLPTSKVFALCGLLGALLNALFALCSSGFASAVVFRFGVGVALAGIYPLGMKLLVTWAPGRAAQTLAWLVAMLTNRIRTRNKRRVRSCLVASGCPYFVCPRHCRCADGVVFRRRSICSPGRSQGQSGWVEFRVSHTRISGCGIRILRPYVGALRFLDPGPDTRCASTGASGNGVYERSGALVVRGDCDRRSRLRVRRRLQSSVWERTRGFYRASRVRKSVPALSICCRQGASLRATCAAACLGPCSGGGFTAVFGIIGTCLPARASRRRPHHAE
jgi:hypothetical protein